MNREGNYENHDRKGEADKEKPPRCLGSTTFPGESLPATHGRADGALWHDDLCRTTVKARLTSLAHGTLGFPHAKDSFLEEIKVFALHYISLLCIASRCRCSAAEAQIYYNKNCKRLQYRIEERRF